MAIDVVLHFAARAIALSCADKDSLEMITYFVAWVHVEPFSKAVISSAIFGVCV